MVITLTASLISIYLKSVLNVKPEGFNVLREHH